MIKIQSVLKANALFSAVCGILMIAFSGIVSEVIGVFNQTQILVTGLILALYALDLYRTSRQSEISTTKVYYFVGLDVLWVVGTAILIWVMPLAFTEVGRWILILVADIVLFFGFLQALSVYRRKTGPTTSESGRAGASST